LEDVYVGLEGVLTGSSRLAQEAREKAASVARGEEIEAKRRELERARQASEAQIAAIRLDFKAKEDELRRAIAEEEDREQGLVQTRVEMGHLRKADSDGSKGPSLGSSIKGENA
jgi:circadian clock protein KaiC